MKVYISGKITNNNNAENDFKCGEMYVRLRGHKVINPLSVGESLVDAFSYEEFMSLDFKLIEMCDGIYMLNNWEKSKGACAELSYAKALGKKINFESKQWRE